VKIASGCVSGPAPPALSIMALGETQHIAEPIELAIPRYGGWRSGLDSWRERAEKRALTARRNEADFRSLERRREEEQQRLALEEKRQREAAERDEQRRREVAEFSTWRDNVIISRRAEERATAREHDHWHSRVSKLRKGLPVSNAGLRGAQGAVTAAAAAVQAITAKAPLHSIPSHDAQCHVDAHPGHGELQAMPFQTITEQDQKLLAEEEAWCGAVSRNREALRAERQRRADEAAKKEEEAQRARVLATCVRAFGKSIQ